MKKTKKDEEIFSRQQILNLLEKLSADKSILEIALEENMSW